MKSKIFFFAASALALTACTSGDVVENGVENGRLIRFENVVNKVSRASDLTKGNLSHFNVFGYYTTPDNDEVAVQEFDDVPVTLDKTSGTWSYTGGDRYWIPNARYYFYAYSCGGADMEGNAEFSMDMKDGLTPSDRILIIKNYLCDNDHQHDLIYASSTGATEENPWEGILAKDGNNNAVAFQFHHILAKVNAQFISKFSSDYTVTISDVSLENIRNLGTYNPNNGGVWNPVTRKNDGRNFVYLLDTDQQGVMPISTTSASEDGVTTPYAYVIPWAYITSAEDAEEAGVSLKFHIVVSNKNQVVFEKDMVGKFHPNWGAGYQYTYTVQISGSAAGLNTIVFTTVTNGDGEIVEWGNGIDDPKITIQ